MRARVKWFHNGYGFLVTKEKEVVFVHYSNIIADGYKVLNKGDIVECDVEVDDKGRKRASNVSVILSIKAVDNVLKEKNLYIRTIKNTQDEYGLKKYEVAHRKTNKSQTSKQGMTLVETAAYAGIDVEELITRKTIEDYKSILKDTMDTLEQSQMLCEGFKNV